MPDPGGIGAKSAVVAMVRAGGQNCKMMPNEHQTDLGSGEFFIPHHLFLLLCFAATL
jgi:hypothetical protein